MPAAPEVAYARIDSPPAPAGRREQPRPDDARVPRRPRRRAAGGDGDPCRCLDPVRRQLEEYFAGARRRVRPAARLGARARLRPGGAARRPPRIPYGETRTYGADRGRGGQPAGVPRGGQRPRQQPDRDRHPLPPGRGERRAASAGTAAGSTASACCWAWRAARPRPRLTRGVPRDRHTRDGRDADRVGSRHWPTCSRGGRIMRQRRTRAHGRSAPSRSPPRWPGSAPRAAAAAATKAPPTKAPTVPLQLLSFNDYHGHLAPPTGSDGNLAGRRHGYDDPGGRRRVPHDPPEGSSARATANTLTVAAGDLIGGSPFLSGPVQGRAERRDAQHARPRRRERRQPRVRRGRPRAAAHAVRRLPPARGLLRRRRLLRHGVQVPRRQRHLQGRA